MFTNNCVLTQGYPNPLETELRLHRNGEDDPYWEREVQNDCDYFLDELDLSQYGIPAIDQEYMANQQDLERYQAWMNTSQDPLIPDGIQADGDEFLDEQERSYSDWYDQHLLPQEEAKALNDWRTGPPFNSRYAQVANPAHLLAQSGIWPNATQRELAAVTCGRGGDHLRRITEQTGVYYIWSNGKRGCFEIWGPEPNLRLAKEALHLHMIYEISNRFVCDSLRDPENLATMYAQAVLGYPDFAQWQDANAW